MKINLVNCAILALWSATVATVNGQKTIIYQNDFEMPWKPLQKVPPACDGTTINTYFGGQGGSPIPETRREKALQLGSQAQKTSHGTGTFGQEDSVEALKLFQAGTYDYKYTATGQGGMNSFQSRLNAAAIGFQCNDATTPRLTAENDRLWLDFTVPQEEEYFAIEMDITSVPDDKFGIMVNQCGIIAAGGNFPPKFHITLRDMDLDKVVQTHDVAGQGVSTASPDYSLNWNHVSVAFYKGSATNLRIEWDCFGGKYSAIDNVVISTTETPPPDAEVVQPSQAYTDEVAVFAAPAVEAADVPVTDAPSAGPSGAPSSAPSLAPATPAPTPAKSLVKTGRSSGDPHFKTFGGKKFDFHGACDLVLLKSPNFAHGLGLNIHIRTKINTWWSFIETAVLQIGADTLEVTGGLDGGSHLLNGKPAEENKASLSLAGFQVTIKSKTSKQKTYRIDFGNGDAISIETYKEFVAVNVRAKNQENFVGAGGLMGAYPNGEMLGRDGSTLMENDANAFGQDWQVLPSEPMLFHSLGEVHAPERCTMPDKTAKKLRRRLGETMVSKEAAALACAHVEDEDRDACIFDVLATNDKDMAGAY